MRAGLGRCGASPSIGFVRGFHICGFGMIDGSHECHEERDNIGDGRALDIASERRHACDLGTSVTGVVDENRKPFGVASQPDIIECVTGRFALIAKRMALQAPTAILPVEILLPDLGLASLKSDGGVGRRKRFRLCGGRSGLIILTVHITVFGRGRRRGSLRLRAG